MCKKRLKDQYQVKYIVVHLAIVIKIMVCSLSTPILQASVNMPRNHRNSNYNCKSKRFLKQKIKGMQKLQCMCSNLQKNASKFFWCYTISGNCRTVTFLCCRASYEIKNCKGS